MRRHSDDSRRNTTFPLGVTAAESDGALDSSRTDPMSTSRPCPKCDGRILWYQRECKPCSDILD